MGYMKLSAEKMGGMKFPLIKKMNLRSMNGMYSGGKIASK